MFPELVRQIVKGNINVRARTGAKENLHEFQNFTDWLKREESDSKRREVGTAGPAVSPGQSPSVDPWLQMLPERWG